MLCVDGAPGASSAPTAPRFVAFFPAPVKHAQGGRKLEGGKRPDAEGVDCPALPLEAPLATRPRCRHRKAFWRAFPVSCARQSSPAVPAPGRKLDAGFAQMPGSMRGLRQVAWEGAFGIVRQTSVKRGAWSGSAAGTLDRRSLKSALRAQPPLPACALRRFAMATRGTSSRQDDPRRQSGDAAWQDEASRSSQAGCRLAFRVAGMVPALGATRFLSFCSRPSTLPPAEMHGIPLGCRTQSDRPAWSTLWRASYPQGYSLF